MTCKIHGTDECVCQGARFWMDRALASEGKLQAYETGHSVELERTKGELAAAKSGLDDALMRLREAVAWFDVVKSKHDTVALIHLADDWPDYWLKITRDLLGGAVEIGATNVTAHVHNHRPSGLVPGEMVCSCGHYYVV